MLQLTPGNACVFSIEAPTNAAEWRFPVRWCYSSHIGFRSLIGMLNLNLELNWKLIRHGIRPRFYSATEVDFYMSYSMPITNRS